MIKHLQLQDLILIDTCKVQFESGLNIISGETGAGKTILLQALALLFGEKSSPSLVRSGAKMAYLEAAFELENNHPVWSLLENLGLKTSDEEFLIIKRIIPSEGRSRCYVGDQMASLHLLQELRGHLIEIVGQSSALKLRSSDEQLRYLDTYSSIDLCLFRKTYREMKDSEKALHELQELQVQGLREKEILAWQKEEIEKAELQADEEEILFKEYEELQTQSASIQAYDLVEKRLNEKILPHLAQCQKEARFSDELSSHLESAMTSLQEASYCAAKVTVNEEIDAKRLEVLDERLSEINKLKKKYGQSVEVILNYLSEVSKKLEAFAHVEERIAEEKCRLEKTRIQSDQEAEKITKQRKEVAKRLEKALSQELQALNMSQARVEIRLEEKPLSERGKESPSFHLTANPGEPPASLKEQTSGGELSRLLFALKSLQTQKVENRSLIFDEIDANVGGTTATLVGEKLQMMGKRGQVIAITHFPQVAQFGSHHLKVGKSQREGRTITSIEVLSKNDHHQELMRMLGGDSLLQKIPHHP